MKVTFSKTGNARFISHLDLMRLFQRASRRAALPVSVTKGFSPHLKISITRALKLGVEGMDQEAVFHMDKRLSPQEFIGKINEQLPEGVRIIKAEETV
ncbi:MAG: TIGR03936 family radical SAM-associated protein [Candidatus Omnitrophota bacterium]|nr:TIGR03936 family radical SAM-associated protein [Candidatus Omnitrophota bacterium]